MPAQITKTPQARRDLVEIATYLGQQSQELALRFVDAAEDAFLALGEMPLMGTCCQFSSPDAEGIRCWSIKGFRDYIVFYRPVSDGIDVVRVLHGARELDSLFGSC